MENESTIGEVLPQSTVEVLQIELAQRAILEENPNIVLGEN